MRSIYNWKANLYLIKRCRIVKSIKRRRKRSVSRTKSFNMVFERSLVLEIRATNAKPSFAAVLLVCPPVSFHSQQLAASATLEGFHAMFPLVVSLKSSKIFERLGFRVVDVVLASLCAAIACYSHHSSRLPSFQRLCSSSILWPMTPHMHLPLILCKPY